MWYTRLPPCFKRLVTRRLMPRFMLALCPHGLASLHLYLDTLRNKSAVICSCADIRYNDKWNVNMLEELWCSPYFAIMLTFVQEYTWRHVSEMHQLWPAGRPARFLCFTPKPSIIVFFFLFLQRQLEAVFIQINISWFTCDDGSWLIDWFIHSFIDWLITNGFEPLRSRCT